MIDRFKDFLWVFGPMLIAAVMLGSCIVLATTTDTCDGRIVTRTSIVNGIDVDTGETVPYEVIVENCVRTP